VNALAKFSVWRGIHVHRQAMREARAAAVVDAELVATISQRRGRRVRYTAAALLEDPTDHASDRLAGAPALNNLNKEPQ
jgi:hypothetical protein